VDGVETGDGVVCPADVGVKADEVAAEPIRPVPLIRIKI